MAILIILAAIYILLVIYLFWMLLKRMRREKDANERIYQDEYYRRFKPDNDFKGEETSYIRTKWDPSDSEGEDSVITFRDLEDIDRSYESHMNW